MDSITQVVFGAAVGGAVAGRTAGWRAFAWGAAIGTMPDLDVFYDYGSPVANFTWHRGYTHSLFTQTLAAPLIALPIRYLQRHGTTSYLHWLAAVWLILVTHTLLDAFTIYGTQLWLPFSDLPVGLGSIFIIDPLFTLPLLIGVAAAIGFRSDWPRARRWNGIALALAGTYLLWTVAAQQWMENRAEQAIAESGLPAARVLATPTAVNSVLWRIIAVGENAHWEALHPIGSDRPIRFREYPRQPELLNDIEDNTAVRRLQHFTHGFYSVNEIDDHVVISDLRMGQVGHYAFAYRVGRRKNGRIQPIPDERHRYPQPDLFVALRDLYACALDRPTLRLDCHEAAYRP